MARFWQRSSSILRGEEVKGFRLVVDAADVDADSKEPVPFYNSGKVCA